MWRLVFCLFLIALITVPTLGQEGTVVETTTAQATASSDGTTTTQTTTSTEQPAKKRFTVPQKAFGMGLVNRNAEVVANAMQRALNRDKPVLIRRGLGFFVIVTRKRGQEIDRNGVTETLRGATEILKGRGYEENTITSLFDRAEF